MSPSTLEDYGTLLTLSVTPVIGNVRLANVRKLHAQAILAAMAEQTSARANRPLSARTMQYVLTVPQGALESAVQDRTFAGNPLPCGRGQVRPPHTTPREQQTHSPTEVDAMLATCGREADAAPEALAHADACTREEAALASEAKAHPSRDARALDSLARAVHAPAGALHRARCL